MHINQLDLLSINLLKKNTEALEKQCCVRAFFYDIPEEPSKSFNWYFTRLFNIDKITAIELAANIYTIALPCIDEKICDRADRSKILDRVSEQGLPFFSYYLFKELKELKDSDEFLEDEYREFMQDRFQVNIKTGFIERNKKLLEKAAQHLHSKYELIQEFYRLSLLTTNNQSWGNENFSWLLWHISDSLFSLSVQGIYHIPEYKEHHPKSISLREGYNAYVRRFESNRSFPKSSQNSFSLAEGIEENEIVTNQNFRESTLFFWSSIEVLAEKLFQEQNNSFNEKVWKIYKQDTLRWSREVQASNSLKILDYSLPITKGRKRGRKLGQRNRAVSL